MGTTYSILLLRKKNRVNILKSVDEGPFQMGTFRETLAEGEEGALHLGPERAQVYSDLSPEDKERYNAEWDRFVTAVKLNRGLKESNYDQLSIKQRSKEQCKGHKARNCTQPKRPQNLEYFKEKMLLMQAQENMVVLDEGQLLFIAGGQDNADECDAFDSDVDEAPTTHTMFMENLSSADPVYDEAGPSYDSNILSKVYDHDNYQDAICEHHEVHEMHDNVQPNCVVDSAAEYTGDSNIILYDQYTAQCVYVKAHTKVVDASLMAELTTYKEQVKLYERRAKFKLTEREQKIEEQIKIVITDRNIKEEYMKKEFHSVKMQLNSTINHNKSMLEEVTPLKKDFKPKENKNLEEFLDMKSLKEKVDDKLFKQDQSL
nr:hypothetical protein [Tanacetum cinerariifolium]